jgi:Fe2+ transport system protein FeoA
MGHKKILTLADLPVGAEAEIIEILGADLPLRQRLIVMGIVPGERIRLTKAAPLGDPLEIRVPDFNNSLMVRKSEAQAVAVEIIGKP